MGTRKPASRVAALRKTATKATPDAKPQTTTLAAIVSNPALLKTLTPMLGTVATEGDATDLGAMVLVDVKTRLAEIGRAMTALSKTLTPDDIRVSTKDGTKAYAYAVVKPEAGTGVSVGIGVSDAVGNILAKHATRKSA